MIFNTHDTIEQSTWRQRTIMPCAASAPCGATPGPSPRPDVSAREVGDHYSVKSRSGKVPRSQHPSCNTVLLAATCHAADRTLPSLRRRCGHADQIYDVASIVRPPCSCDSLPRPAITGLGATTPTVRATDAGLACPGKDGTEQQQSAAE